MQQIWDVVTGILKHSVLTLSIPTRRYLTVYHATRHDQCLVYHTSVKRVVACDSFCCIFSLCLSSTWIKCSKRYENYVIGLNSYLFVVLLFVYGHICASFIKVVNPVLLALCSDCTNSSSTFFYFHFPFVEWKTIGAVYRRTWQELYFDTENIIQIEVWSKVACWLSIYTHK